MITCSICKTPVTEPYCNPLDFEKRITCWYHADYFYIMHPDRVLEAQKQHRDIPNFQLHA